MSYKEIAEKYNLPTKLIIELCSRSILHQPISDSEHDGLLMLSSIWGKDVFIKLQLTKKSQRERLKLALTSSLTKIESYILSRYIGNLRTKERLYVNQIADELNFYYGAPKDRLLYHTIRKIRARAYKFYNNNEKIKDAFSGKIRRKSKPKQSLNDENKSQNTFNKVFGY